MLDSVPSGSQREGLMWSIGMLVCFAEPTPITRSVIMLDSVVGRRRGSISGRRQRGANAARIKCVRMGPASQNDDDDDDDRTQVLRHILLQTLLFCAPRRTAPGIPTFYTHFIDTVFRRHNIQYIRGTSRLTIG